MSRCIYVVVSIAVLASVVPPGCAKSDQSKGGEAMKLARPAPRPPEYPAPKVEAIDRELRTGAAAQLDTALKSQSAFSRAHAIEASKYLPADQMRKLVLDGASQASSVVKFASMMTAGEMRLADAQGPALRLVSDPDHSVQAAAIFCLHRLGNRQYSHALETLATDPDHFIRANTAMLVGLLGEPSGERILRHLLGDADTLVRLQAAEGLWRLKKQDVLEYLVSSTISRYPDDQMIAALAIAAPRDPRVAEHLRGMLTTAYPEVNLVAARALGMLGFDEGYGVAMQGMKSDDARQRQLAAMAFGGIGRPDAQQMLGKLLKDTDEDVRIAASSALLQLH